MEMADREIHIKAIAGDDEAFLELMQLYKEDLLRNEHDAFEGDV